MSTAEFRQAVQAMTTDQATEAAIELTKGLPPDKQKEVVAKGIDKGAWPQESRHRMFTILGALVIAVVILPVGVWASAFKGAEQIVTAAPLLASAIVGGIFGFSQASK